MGLLLIMASTPQRTVWSPSSSKHGTLRVEFRTFLTDLISLSHDPP